MVVFYLMKYQYKDVVKEGARDHWVTRWQHETSDE